ncbi:DUF732 domain-containing protein [Pseudonocardia broussonetiae]|uniref:DUF732 domain-containing protein n=1 Tax=Pseudonocardia broussonetiae TaxID=2736640 RepID=A0A6M6JJV2_9PSEU|nr:DUF732 domain-containing protein [Pseudonocardia broussonetiae]QJY46631.1 hypothetical protein HOP40_13065 [Pseudonocardia broussonetiae]
MRLAVAVALLVLAGCSAAPAPDPGPGPRVLMESQVRVFTDRVIAQVLASDPDPTTKLLASRPDLAGGGVYSGTTTYRDYVEEEGRAVCSHMIAGVKPNQAYAQAFPNAPRITPQSDEQQMVQLAAELLCPTT